MCLAIPGEVLRIREHDGLLHADVRFAGVQRRICIECTPDVHPGDYVLAHAGFALQRVDEREANLMLAALRELEAGSEAP
ncbi:MAG TPA: HypC/HybG/HupF family hydrogenase formation chaperone [Candidatus Acidoferrales bacterium]|nr:HypC/HybG/HupF family hydrogenase formation chaperone [Candidatus Acidoferrales bacterium]